jgi:phytoene synthase
MSRHELDTAGILEPGLRASYDACRRRNAAHGRTYYLATLLLPAAKRPAVHALYAFARHADDLVDTLEPIATVESRDRALAGWAEAFLAGDSSDPLLPAVHDTIARYDIPRQLFVDFLAAMRMDLTTSSYQTWEDLQGYVHGSAAVIG